MRWWLGMAWALALATGCGNDRRLPTESVGPAPLRRLSNAQYLYALGDLFPAVHVALPPLPADNSVSGFENEVDAQAPSDVRIARFESIANQYAAEATKDAAAIAAVTGCADTSAACAALFIKTQGARIYRRPLTTDEQTHFEQRFAAWQAAIDFAGAVQLTLSAMLQSPQFLYLAEPLDAAPAGGGTLAPVEPYAMASRMSFFLWESIPDDALLAAAQANALASEDQVRAQAARMLKDPRALRVAWDFDRQWLALDRILGDEHTVRVPDIDAAWSPATQVAAVRESRAFVEHSFSEVGTIEDLLTSRRAWIDPEMARVYGVPGPTDPTTTLAVELPAGQRAGILTRTAFLAGYSHRGGTSPPIRGNGINLRLLCQLPAPPPDDVDLSMPMADPIDGPVTNRELFEERTQGPCQQCHRQLNGFGFGFENYTASGAYITEQSGLPIDATGAIYGTDIDGPFHDALDLSAALASSQTVLRCVTQKWFQFALGRAPVPAEADLVDELGTRFIEAAGDQRVLLTEIVASQTFRMRKVMRK